MLITRVKKCIHFISVYLLGLLVVILIVGVGGEEVILVLFLNLCFFLYVGAVSKTRPLYVENILWSSTLTDESSG